MKATNRFFLACNLALACVACNATPQAELPSQPAPSQASSPQSTFAQAAATPPAANDSTVSGEQALMARAKISRAVATQIALAQVANGTIRDGELEEEHQKLVWSFDIASPDSSDITEIQVDALTGQIASTQVETPADQAEETAADQAGH